VNPLKKQWEAANLYVSQDPFIRLSSTQTRSSNAAGADGYDSDSSFTSTGSSASAAGAGAGAGGRRLSRGGGSSSRSRSRSASQSRAVTPNRFAADDSQLSGLGRDYSNAKESRLAQKLDASFQEFLARQKMKQYERDEKLQRIK
jgi:hypothetical protein